MTNIGKSELERARNIPVLNYENVEGLPANPTPEQEAVASIAQSLKRLADHFTRADLASASAGGGEKQGPHQLDYAGERLPIGETRDPADGGDALAVHASASAGGGEDRTIYKAGFGPADGADAVLRVERVNHGVVTGVYDEDGNLHPWPPAHAAPEAGGDIDTPMPSGITDRDGFEWAISYFSDGMFKAEARIAELERDAEVGARAIARLASGEEIQSVLRAHNETIAERDAAIREAAALREAMERVRRFLIQWDDTGNVYREPKIEWNYPEFKAEVEALTAALSAPASAISEGREGPDLGKVRWAGQALANMAFNLAQQTYVPAGWQRSLRDGYKEWDAALLTLTPTEEDHDRT